MRAQFVFIIFVIILSWNAEAELSPEPVPNVEVLPRDYPDNWIFAHDVNFASLLTGQVVVLDIAADTKEYKGSLDASQFGTFIQSAKRDELYVGETFYSRGTRGDRTDVVTIYDKATLKRIDEIVLPGGKRAQIVINKYAMQLIDEDRYLLVLNFTPAISVTVIDIEKREVLSEIPIGGCNMIYPSGKRGFSSLCGDGTLMSVSLDSQGNIVDRTRSDVFFNPDEDPIFDKPVYLDGTAFFPSFEGNMQPIEMSQIPTILPTWSLLDSQAAMENWRPSGWQIISGNDGLLYVLMQKNGFPGSHKSGGEEVWVFDPSEEKRIRRILLSSPGFSIEVTPGKYPLLAVTGTDMGIWIYDTDGKLHRNISVGAPSAMPIMLNAKR